MLSTPPIAKAASAIGDLDLFARVARSGNLAAAGKDAGLSSATISKRISDLEKRVGAPLFVRKARSLELSATGEAYFKRVLEILELVAEADDFVARRHRQQSAKPPVRSGAHSESSRIAKFLGLQGWQKFTDIALASAIKQGLPVQSIAQVFAKVGLDNPRQIHAFIPKATYARKAKVQKLSRTESERLFSVAKVFAEILRIYGGDVDDAESFLTRAHPLLGNRSPFELTVESLAGADSVMKLLARADAGVAV